MGSNSVVAALEPATPSTLSTSGDETPAGEIAAEGQARHKLVIFDSQAQAPATPGNAAIRFHGMRASDSDDALDQFGLSTELGVVQNPSLTPSFDTRISSRRCLRNRDRLFPRIRRVWIITCKRFLAFLNTTETIPLRRYRRES
jgi:hypothetical protein